MYNSNLCTKVLKVKNALKVGNSYIPFSVLLFIAWQYLHYYLLHKHSLHYKYYVTST